MPDSLHRYTPTLTAVDSRGLAVRSVAYHRTSSDTQAQARISLRLFGTTGFLAQQWDPRLSALRAQQSSVSPNLCTYYSLAGQPLKTQSVDAGSRLLFRGVAGQVLTRWDSRGALKRYEYDQQLRPTAVFEHAAHETAERAIERFSYADNDAAYRPTNRCGRVIRHDDPSGILQYEGYSLLGQQLSEQRIFYPVTGSASVLDQPRYTTTWQYDAFGALVEQTDAKGHVQHSRYAVDGLLLQSALTLKGGSRQVLLDQRVYNASGQIESEWTGNNVTTELEYSPLNGRLKRLTAYRVGQQNRQLQDLTYHHDRVGNVLRVSDSAQPVQWSSNAQINPVSTYRYDSLYQLISATGRENASHTPAPGVPGLVLFGATDNSVWRNYTQVYTYDEGGNLTVLKHQVSAGHGYTRTMAIAQGSNHALLKNNDSPAQRPGLGRDFDLNGNQLELVRGQPLQWSVGNELSAVTLVARTSGINDDEVYTYDGIGERVRKVRSTRTQGLTHTLQVLYLPGLEIRHDSATGEHLNVIRAQGGRSAVSVLQWDEGRPRDIPDKQMRFSLSDHLDSSTLELNGQAELISQESYYPYGGTAWWAAKSAVQGKYKITRYSGKELDASGLYYFGFRYYAPWIQRWVSADPASDINGLNIYAMAQNNPITLSDSIGLNGIAPDTRPHRIQALDKFLRDNHPHVYPSALDYFDHQYSMFKSDLNTPVDSAIRALRAAGYSYKEISSYNASVSIAAPLPGNIFSGLTKAYIASANYFNEPARALTNPSINPEPGDWTGKNIVNTFEAMLPQGEYLSDSGQSELSAALSVSRPEAVRLLDLHARYYPSGQTTTYRGHRVSDVGLKALVAHANKGDVLRTEQFLSVSDQPGVAKKFATGMYDARSGPFNPVMLTVIGSSALELHSPVNEAERVYPLETAFKIEHPGLSNLGLRAYVPRATHFVLREVTVAAQKRHTLPFMTDPGGRRGR